uniref:Ig-like domain-containing protein n=1 Tax=Oreochromis aureus TaxID=47969 RepID=A0A668SWE6_OREAU
MQRLTVSYNERLLSLTHYVHLLSAHVVVLWKLTSCIFCYFACLSGQDVTLQCRVRHSNITILVLEWKRADLGDEYVLLYHDGYFVPQVQHPSFKNRVDVQDRQMKDGDVSLILKDVTINDTGTYECRALVLESLSREVNIISLNVVPPGETNLELVLFFSMKAGGLYLIIMLSYLIHLTISYIYSTVLLSLLSTVNIEVVFI